MSNYVNLTPLNIETKNRVVFYSDKDSIIYREKSSIVLESCKGEIKGDIPCPSEFRNYETLDLGDSVLLVLGGTTVVIFYKDGYQPIKYTIDPHKVGRVVSKLFRSKNENAVIFCTLLNNKMQIIIYDFMGQKKISQSSSWKFFNLTSMCMDDKQICCLFDSSFIVGCDIETCETLWTRFEAAPISQDLVLHDGSLIYTCNGALRKHTKIDDKPTQIENISIPSRNVSRILDKIDKYLILMSNNNYDLLLFDLSDKTVKWELVGNEFIFNGITVLGKVGKEIINAVVLHIKDHISIVNLDAGRSMYNNRSNNVYKVRQSGDHIVINKKNYETDIIIMEND